MCEYTYLRLLSLLEESLLGLLLGLLLLGEVVSLGDLLEDLLVNSLEIDLGAGGDDVAVVHSSERDTIDLEGTSHEEDTLRQMLQENNTLATETTSQEDQDGTRLEAFPELRRLNALANLLFCINMSESKFLFNCAFRS